MDELLSWQSLASVSGASATVAVITQGIKDLPFIKKIPTRLISMIIAVIIMELSLVFTVGFSVSGFFLQIFNGIFVALSANGTYSALAEAKQG